MADAEWLLTDWEDELNARDRFPSQTVGSGGKGLVDARGNDGPGVEEELQRDDDETTDRDWDNLGLVCAEVKLVSFALPAPFRRGDPRYIDFDQTDRHVNNDAANDELREAPRSRQQCQQR